jgi:hypothetical protein
MIWNGKNIKEIIKYLSSIGDFGIVDFNKENKTLTITTKDKKRIVKVGEYV